MLRDRLDPHQRERLTVVEESAATLLSIINDILDYSKIEAGRMAARNLWPGWAGNFSSPCRSSWRPWKRRCVTAI